MRRHDRILWLIRVTVALSLSSDGFAADLVKLPPINLGTTAFRDGVAGPGTLLQINSGFSRADSFKSGNGDSLPGDNRIDVNAYLLQLAHITKHRLFGGFYGAEVLVPYSNINPDTSLRGLPKQSESGVGDVLLSPFMLQWVRSDLFGKSYFHRLNFIFSVPTGRYDAKNDVNPGSNLVKFNPYYAGTLNFSPAVSASFRLHYLWSSKNRDPAVSMNARSIQPGTAFHMNYALTYKISTRLRIGLAGYYLNQLSEDKIDGVKQRDSKERVAAFGPGLRYGSNSGFLNLNGFYEFGAENRTQGYRVVLRYAWFFK